MRPRFLDFVYTQKSVLCESMRDPGNYNISSQTTLTATTSTIVTNNDGKKKDTRREREPSPTRRGNNISHHQKTFFFFIYIYFFVISQSSRSFFLFLFFCRAIQPDCIRLRLSYTKNKESPTRFTGLLKILNCCPPPVFCGVRFQHYNFFFPFFRDVIIFRFTI